MPRQSPYSIKLGKAEHMGLQLRFGCAELLWAKWSQMAE
jgi:hypothetical protein